MYKPSFELLAHLNIKNIEDLPEYEAVRKDIESFKSTGVEEEKKEEKIEALSDSEILENEIQEDSELKANDDSI